MDIISAILDIDNKARLMMKDAEHECAEIMQKAAQTEETVKTDIEAEVERKLSEYESAEKTGAQERLESVEKEKQAELQKLDRAFEQNRERWEETIFNAVIDQ